MSGTLYKSSEKDKGVEGGRCEWKWYLSSEDTAYYISGQAGCVSARQRDERGGGNFLTAIRDTPTAHLGYRDQNQEALEGLWPEPDKPHGKIPKARRPYYGNHIG